MSLHRHRRWVEREGWRGRDGTPDFCEWCERSIWFWRRRARMVWAFDPHLGPGRSLGRYVWVHSACAEHMKADKLAR